MIVKIVWTTYEGTVEPIIEIEADFETIRDMLEKFKALDIEVYNISNFIEYLNNHGIKAHRIKVDAELEF